METNGKCVIFGLGGPILFTAPHGISLWRGGGESGIERQKHLSEYYVTEIVLKLAKHAEKMFHVPGSFIIWDTRNAKAYDEDNWDPNFLPLAQFATSPWHRRLKTFVKYGHKMDVPIFHVDIHGKKDLPDSIAVDIGSTAMRVFLKDQHLVEGIVKRMVDSLTDVFKNYGIVKDGPEFSVNTEGMTGHWQSGRVFTMSSQSAKLGVPSVQLEIPFTMRKKLVTDEDFFVKFADCILKVYEEIVCKGQLRSTTYYKHQSKILIDVESIQKSLFGSV